MHAGVHSRPQCYSSLKSHLRLALRFADHVTKKTEALGTRMIDVLRKTFAST